MKKIKQPSKLMPNVAEPNLAFRFDQMKQRGIYSFSYFGKDVRSELIAKSALIEFLLLLSNRTLSQVRIMSKEIGCEIIQLRFFNKDARKSLKNCPIVDADARLHVFRFCNQQYRIICIQDSKMPFILHILMFDFDFSAYNHG